MPISETSGKNGYLSSGGVEYPLYSWNLSSQRVRETYRKSNSANFPRRRTGLAIDSLTISGPGPISPIGGTTQTDFNIGVIDWTNNIRRFINFDGALSSDKITFEYGKIFSTFWTSTLVGTATDKLFASAVIPPLEDHTICVNDGCDYSDIGTTDTSVNWITRVRKAELETLYERELYRTSNSNNHYKFTQGALDSFLTFDIDGNFDYWLYRLTYDIPYVYTLYYNASEYLTTQPMLVLDVTNLAVNIRTGELISATVKLGATNG